MKKREAFREQSGPPERIGHLHNELLDGRVEGSWTHQCGPANMSGVKSPLFIHSACSGPPPPPPPPPSQTSAAYPGQHSCTSLIQYPCTSLEFGAFTAASPGSFWILFFFLSPVPVRRVMFGCLAPC